MSKAAKTHLDATKTAGTALRYSLCGFPGVLTTTDATHVTCGLCLARLRDGKRESKPGKRAAQANMATLARELHLELRLGEDLAPKAPPPPRMTPELWHASCDDGRCRDCELCSYYSELDRWAFVAPWTQQAAASRRTTGRRWTSLNGALQALLEYERTGRDSRSALASMLIRIEFCTTAPRSSAPSAKVLAIDDIVHVKVALERAYAGKHCRIPPADCVQLLLERTPGVQQSLTPYPDLVARYGLPAGELQSIVRRGRRMIEEDLVARGLLEPPRPRRHRAEQSVKWKAADAF